MSHCMDDFNAALDVVRRHDDYQSRHDLRVLVSEIIGERDRYKEALDRIKNDCDPSFCQDRKEMFRALYDANDIATKALSVPEEVRK